MKKLIICAICAFCGTITASAQKFGHLNTQEVLQVMPEYSKAQQEMEALAKQYEDDLKQMQEEIQKKQEEFGKLAADTPDGIKQRKQNEIEKLMEAFQDSYQQSQQALGKAEQEKMGAIQTKLFDAIKAVGLEGGYVYIMNIASAVVVPYVSTTLSTDVTAQVKAKLGVK